MGLAQRRIVEDFKTNAFGAWKKEFDLAVGFDLPVDVKWDTLQSEDYQNRDDYFKWYKQVYFQPLLTAFKDLCADQMGKDAVKETVKKIVIDGTDGSSPRASRFEGGVLMVNHRFSTNVDNEKERADGWREMIEAKL